MTTFDITSISFVEYAVNNKMTAKQFVSHFADYGFMPDQTVSVLSELIPQAFNGLNAEAVKLLCNAIKYCA